MSFILEGHLWHQHVYVWTNYFYKMEIKLSISGISERASGFKFGQANMLKGRRNSMWTEEERISIVSEKWKRRSEWVLFVILVFLGYGNTKMWDLTVNISDDEILNFVCHVNITFDLHWCLAVNEAFFWILVPFSCIFSPKNRTGLIMFAYVLYHSSHHNVYFLKCSMSRSWSSLLKLSFVYKISILCSFSCSIAVLYTSVNKSSWVDVYVSCIFSPRYRAGLITLSRAFYWISCGLCHLAMMCTLDMSYVEHSWIVV